MSIRRLVCTVPTVLTSIRPPFGQLQVPEPGGTADSMQARVNVSSARPIRKSRYDASRALSKGVGPPSSQPIQSGTQINNVRKIPALIFDSPDLLAEFAPRDQDLETNLLQTDSVEDLKWRRHKNPPPQGGPSRTVYGAIRVDRGQSAGFDAIRALQLPTQAMCVARWRRKVALQRATQVPRGGY